MNKALTIIIFIALVFGAVWFLRPNDTIEEGASNSVSATSKTLDLDFDPTHITAEGTTSDFFMGIREPSTDELFLAFPELKKQPHVLTFTSRFCLDCKKMKPLLAAIVPDFSGLNYQSYDILEDKDKAPAVFNTFKPVTVPTVIFIQPDGSIQNVLYNSQDEAQLRAAFNDLSNSSQKTTGAEAAAS